MPSKTERRREIKRQSIPVFAVVVLSALGPWACQPAIGGSIVAWGYDNYGQVSNVPKGDDFIAIGAGAYHGIALKSDGSLVAWGMDTDGQVSETPSGNDFVAVANSGNCHASLALKADGSIVAWGATDGYPPPDNDYVRIVGLGGGGAALRFDGSLVAWGPHPYSPQGSDYIDMATDSEHGIALKSGGSLESWGNDSPVVRNVPTGNDFIDLSCAYGTTSFALKQDGTIVTWGWLGPESRVDPPQDGDVVKIFSSHQFNGFGLRSNGSIVGWGIDYSGVLSDIPTGTGFVEIASGEYWAMALTPEPDVIPAPSAFVLGTIGAGLVGWLRRRRTL